MVQRGYPIFFDRSIAPEVEQEALSVPGITKPMSGCTCLQDVCGRITERACCTCSLPLSAREPSPLATIVEDAGCKPDE